MKRQLQVQFPLSETCVEKNEIPYLIFLFTYVEYKHCEKNKFEPNDKNYGRDVERVLKLMSEHSSLFVAEEIFSNNEFLLLIPDLIDIIAQYCFNVPSFASDHDALEDDIIRMAHQVENCRLLIKYPRPTQCSEMLCSIHHHLMEQCKLDQYIKCSPGSALNVKCSDKTIINVKCSPGSALNVKCSDKTIINANCSAKCTPDSESNKFVPEPLESNLYSNGTKLPSAEINSSANPTLTVNHSDNPNSDKDEKCNECERMKNCTWEFTLGRSRCNCSNKKYMWKFKPLFDYTFEWNKLFDLRKQEDDKARWMYRDYDKICMGYIL